VSISLDEVAAGKITYHRVTLPGDQSADVNTAGDTEVAI
jgi:hypothetical protein